MSDDDRTEFLEQCRAFARYWDTVAEFDPATGHWKTQRDRIDGAIFSVLNLIDSGEFPIVEIAGGLHSGFMNAELTAAEIAASQADVISRIMEHGVHPSHMPLVADEDETPKIWRPMSTAPTSIRIGEMSGDWIVATIEWPGAIVGSTGKPVKEVRRVRIEAILGKGTQWVRDDGRVISEPYARILAWRPETEADRPFMGEMGE